MTTVSGSGWVMHNADCVDVMRGMADGSVDHVITDPPYSEHVHKRSIRRIYLPDVADQPCRKTRAHAFGFVHLNPELQSTCASEFARLASRWTLVFSDTELADSWRQKLTGFVRFGFWVKDRAMPQISGDRPGSRVEQITIAHPKGRKRWNGGGLGNVWQHPVVVNCNGHRQDRIHTAQKPLTLMRELIGLFTNPGDTIFDPFAGSATTGIACLQMGRKFIGVELDEKYFALACDRLRAEEQTSTLQALRAGQESLFK